MYKINKDLFTVFYTQVSIIVYLDVVDLEYYVISCTFRYSTKLPVYIASSQRMS